MENIHKEEVLMRHHRSRSILEQVSDDPKVMANQIVDAMRALRLRSSNEVDKQDKTLKTSSRQIESERKRTAICSSEKIIEEDEINEEEEEEEEEEKEEIEGSSSSSQVDISSALKMVEAIRNELKAQISKIDSTEDIVTTEKKQVLTNSKKGIPLVNAPKRKGTKCSKCQKDFSAFNRCKNCTTCGYAFCPKCTASRLVLPNRFGYGEESKRVCNLCMLWFQDVLDREISEFKPPSPTGFYQNKKKKSPQNLQRLQRSQSTFAAVELEQQKEPKKKHWWNANLHAMHFHDPRPKSTLQRSMKNPPDHRRQQKQHQQQESENEELSEGESDEETPPAKIEEDEDGDIELEPSTRLRGATLPTSFPFANITNTTSTNINLSRIPEISRLVTKSDEKSCASSAKQERLYPETTRRGSKRVKNVRSASFDCTNLHSVTNSLESPPHKQSAATGVVSPTEASDAVSSPGSIQQPGPQLPMTSPSNGVGSGGRNVCFDDSDIIDALTSEDMGAIGSELPSSVSNLRFAVYELGGMMTKESPSLRRTLGFGKKNRILDRYTLEVDYWQGIVRAKSVFQHRFWSFRSDSVRHMIASTSNTSLRLILQNSSGEEEQSVEFQFANEDEREEFKLAVQNSTSFNRQEFLKRISSSISNTSGNSNGTGEIRSSSTPPHVLRSYTSHGGQQRNRPVSPLPALSIPLPRSPALPPGQEVIITTMTSLEDLCTSPSESFALKNVSIQFLPGEKEVKGAAWPATLVIGAASGLSSSSSGSTGLSGEANVWGRIRGLFAVTNYRVLFMPFERGHLPFRRSTLGSIAYIPLFAIISVQKFTYGSNSSSRRMTSSTKSSPLVGTISMSGASAMGGPSTGMIISGSTSVTSNIGPSVTASMSGTGAGLYITCKDIRTMRVELDRPTHLSEERAQILQTLISRLADATQRYEKPLAPSSKRMEANSKFPANPSIVMKSPRAAYLGTSTNGELDTSSNVPMESTTDSTKETEFYSSSKETYDHEDALECGSFALSYSLPKNIMIDPSLDGWNLFQDELEFKRQIGTEEVDKQMVHPFLKFFQNAKGSVCLSYPSKILLPSSIDAQALTKIASFRAKNRLPVITWYHRQNRCVLTRSGQPLLGSLLTGNSNLQDQLLLGIYRRFPEIIRYQNASSASSRPLYIFDARKYKASTGNRLMGKGGVETPQDYPGAFIYHLNIGNMYRMQSSFQALMKLLLPGGVEDNDKTWWSSVESTRWLEHVRLLLEGSLKIARVLELEGSSVLVHCSDGWDRTSQLVSLAQLMIDPYYRTIRGFAVLVEKDWCAFGHKFAERSGGDRNRDNARHKSSPIMLQFLDAVWQIWRQFRSAFEFNERFLLHVANSLTSGLFGTFLYDTRVDREINRLSTRTVSVWTPVLLNVQTYTNPEYIEWTKPIWPWTGSPMIRLWEGYFFQWHPKYFDCGWISSLVHYGPLQDAQSTNSNLFTRMNCRDSTLASSQQREKDVTQEKEEEEEEVDDEVEERKDSSIANIPVPTSFLSLSRSSLGASNRSSCHSSSKWNLFLFNK